MDLLEKRVLPEGLWELLETFPKLDTCTDGFENEMRPLSSWGHRKGHRACTLGCPDVALGGRCQDCPEDPALGKRLKPCVDSTAALCALRGGAPRRIR